MREDDALVLVACVDRLGEVGDHADNVGVGDDLSGGESGDQPSVGGRFSSGSCCVRVLIAGHGEVAFDALQAVGDGAAQDSNLFNRKVVGHCPRAARRVLSSRLPVVRLPVGVSAPPAAAYMKGGPEGSGTV